MAGLAAPVTPPARKTRAASGKQAAARGYVYILKNPYVPELVKIGYTDRQPQTRAEELSQATGVPGKWQVHHSFRVRHAHQWEQKIFAHLSEYRETGEFFRLAPEVAQDKINGYLLTQGAWAETSSHEADASVEVVPSLPYVPLAAAQLKRYATYPVNDEWGDAAPSPESPLETRVGAVLILLMLVTGLVCIDHAVWRWLLPVLVCGLGYWPVKYVLALTNNEERM